jgi:hypothetical protein
MNFKNNNVLYKTTCDNKTYKLKQRANQGLCCMGCINRGRRDWYYIHQWDGKQKQNIPSWKLVSKNKKQWMKKPLKYKESTSWGRLYTTISW